MIIIRDYQRLKQTKYILPRSVYHTTIWRIRDYFRLKQLADDIIKENSTNDDMCGYSLSNAISDTVASKVVRRDKYLSEVKKIDDALILIPTEYRQGVWNNIQFGQPYPLDADRTTYGRYKSKFIYSVAYNLELI